MTTEIASTALPGVAASVPAARRFLRTQLRGWRVEEFLGDQADVAYLLLSEVATNALLHARSGFDVYVRWDGRRLRVEVVDGSPLPPQRQRFSVGAGTGRGVGLVADLALRWGVDNLEGGKAVWFEVGLEDAVLPVLPEHA